MIDLIFEIAAFFLVLAFLMPLMLILAVLLHTLTELGHKHRLWHKRDAGVHGH
jgi:hypothetical protein